MCYRNTSLINWCAERDSNPQPIRYERTALPLSYQRIILVGTPGFDPGQEHPSGAKEFINLSRVQHPPPNIIIIYNNIKIDIKQYKSGGPDRTRTRYLLNANQTLSLLSYWPLLSFISYFFIIF